MKKSMVMSVLLPVLICGGVFAQNGNPVTWEMAVIQQIGSEVNSFPPQRINLESGDKYCIYVKSDSQGYCYVIQEDSNEVSSLIFSGNLAAGRPVQVMENSEDSIFYTVPSGTGIIRYDIVVSSTPIPNLERYWNQGAGRSLTRAQQTAIGNEVIAIRNSISTFAETPAKPVDMGGNVRGRVEVPKAYQYEGQDTYVKTVTIRY